MLLSGSIGCKGSMSLQWRMRRASLSEPLTLPRRSLSIGGVFFDEGISMIREGDLEKGRFFIVFFNCLNHRLHGLHGWTRIS